MKNNKIGIMQGRLTPSHGRGIQFFPFENWENEFQTAKSIGLNFIEFIFDTDRFEENPLWTKTGRATIKDAIKKTGVKVNAISLDYFMRNPLFDDVKKGENKSVFEIILMAAEDIGTNRVEIPILDNSSINTIEKQKSFRAITEEFVSMAQKKSITVAIESDLPPNNLSPLLSSFHSRVKAVYDTGNSAAANYNPVDEITAYGALIANVHLKDRVLNGDSVPLETGAANFPIIFRELKKINYSGDITLQAARGSDGEEAETVSQQLAFVQNLF